MKLEDRTIVIFGASGGIGRILAREFHREGASLALAARTKEKLDDLAAALGRERVLTRPTDAALPDEVLKLLIETKEAFGRVDAVVISVGTWGLVSLNNSAAAAKLAAVDHFYKIFLPSFVVSFTAQSFFFSQDLDEQRLRGRIFNISSHAAVRPDLKGNLTYGPMKAAVRHFMLGLRAELGGYSGSGILVTDIQPAIVNTPDNAHWLDTVEKRAKAVQPEAIARWIMEKFDNPDIPAEQLFDSDIVL